MQRCGSMYGLGCGGAPNEKCNLSVHTALNLPADFDVTKVEGRPESAAI